MQLFKTPNIRFLKYKYVALGIAFAIVLAGVLNIAVFKGLKLGVDFGEGTLLRVVFKSPSNEGHIRDLLQTVGLGKSQVQKSGTSGREFQIRAVESVRTKPNDQDQLEAHEALADKIIEALRGDDGAAERARGLIDLNTLDEKSLTALLESSFPGSGPESARAILAQRNKTGIIASFQELSGLKPEVRTYLQDKTYLGGMTVLSRETVGPQVGSDLRRKAVQATIWSLLGMLVYIALRFKLEYGVAAIFTLAQDVLITMSIYSFTNREINLPIIAGILTIVGFSINDTIVIFDRVRENQKLLRGKPLEEVMNVSLNQCLGRTIITSGTVFLTVMALFLFAGDVINDFAFLMLLGTIEGVYSTIYMSCPVVLFWQRWFKPKNAGRR
ncbi:MAG TPA: protein translocase subunit SecF [Candidatus Aminicenantes bacterium]|nr:protein translocase subunit SecF [Candidatus Aminicenantes bacterium]HRY66305.1 protein translocase subunit SecF [Candidatus Aminicenantes bacterium]HRZ73248.1 protein translocase subunit SecF [Candidatus Aminicenantes bacterium]